MIFFMLWGLSANATSLNVGPKVAIVPNDPFLKRQIVGLETTSNIFNPKIRLIGSINYSPDLDKADWKPLTTQLVEENSISPDLSKILVFGSVVFDYQFSTLQDESKTMQFSVNGGFGFVQTKDDLTALQKEDDPQALSTEVQVHSTINTGIRLDTKFKQYVPTYSVSFSSIQYVETIDGTTLEMKNNFVLGFGLIMPIGGL